QLAFNQLVEGSNPSRPTTLVIFLIINYFLAQPFIIKSVQLAFKQISLFFEDSNLSLPIAY
ncbi:MAG: hypothetical protein ACPGUD_14655, partial [Parashewanella sp.]